MLMLIPCENQQIFPEKNPVTTEYNVTSIFLSCLKQKKKKTYTQEINTKNNKFKAAQQVLLHSY